MRVIFSIIGILIFFSGTAQIEKEYWSTEASPAQKLRWENGEIKVEHQILENGAIIRKEYFPDGTLKLKAEVIQEFCTDSVFTQKTHSPNVLKGYCDIAHGPYQDFHPNGIPKSRGEFRKNKKTGEWVYWDEQGNEIKKE